MIEKILLSTLVILSIGCFNKNSSNKIILQETTNIKSIAFSVYKKDVNTFTPSQNLPSILKLNYNRYQYLIPSINTIFHTKKQDFTAEMNYQKTDDKVPLL